MPALSVLTLGVFKDDPYTALAAVLTPSDHPHPRERIADWAEKRLRAAALLPQAIVAEISSGVPLENMPLVMLFCAGELDPTVRGEGPRELERVCTLSIDLAIREHQLPEGVQMRAVVHAFCRVIELVLLNDRSSDGCLGGLADEIELGAQAIEIERDSERIVHHVRIEFRVTYADELAVPVSTALEQMNIRWNLAPPDGVIDAEDEIQLEQ